jgi:hypothetical protein
MSDRLKREVASRVQRAAQRWAGLSGATSERSALRSEIHALGARLDALEAVLNDMWRRAELAADNRALGLQDLALNLQVKADERDDARHEQALAAAERSADALVANVRRSIESAARELQAVADELRVTTAALEAQRAGTAG